MKNQKGKGILRLLAIVVIIAATSFIAAVGLGSSQSGSANDIKLGLDLAGGVSITYEATDPNPSDEAMADTIHKLLLRVQVYSTEAEVYKEGVNRINVDIPGVSDANAVLEALGKPGSLVFLDESQNVILTGDQVVSAQPGILNDSTTGAKKYVVNLKFSDEGSAAFAEATAQNLNKRIAIVYDGQIYSNPVVNSVITGGECYVEGMESYEAAEDLAATIRIGSLSLELQELRSNVVGAKLGQTAISTSLKAGAIGFAIVLVFMAVVYLIPGLAAGLALAIYVALMVMLLSAFEITLTLPGIAGIILSIGMAVDANVIIFARIREEIGAGKTVGSAIKVGFNKALSAIIDGNITTLIAAFVLFWRGSGSVKGFASTLALGIILSMFTALVVTKFILNSFYMIGLDKPKFYGSTKEVKVINFVGKKNICFIISVAMILAGFVAMGINAAGGSMLNYSMEFKGGTSTNVTFNEDLSMERVHSEVVPLVEKITGDADVQTQKVAGSNEVIIKTRTLNVEERQALNDSMVENFGVEEEKITAESISGAVSKEMKQDAFIAVIIATICMLLYIWFRFKDIKFATSAVLALIHDVLVVLTCYAIARWSVGSTFIACMLTIVGYSINATIVIFDRIRENLKTMRKQDTMSDIVNLSISQTLTRSINTSLTTFVMVLVLFILGVSSIREFALPLMAGIICGTYSSVCVTGSLWYVMTTKMKSKK